MAAEGKFYLDAYIHLSVLHGARPPFVSLMSEYGQVPIEQISQEVGHRRQATTETVYRHQLKPRRHVAGRTMDKVIGDARKAS